MRIDPVSLIAAQAARALPKAQALPREAAPAAEFAPLDFPKKTASEPAGKPGSSLPPQRPGAKLDITV